MDRESKVGTTSLTSSSTPSNRLHVPSPGKQSLVDGISGSLIPSSAGAPVQRSTNAGTASQPDLVHAAAARGITGAAGALPHLDAIQRSFGRHAVGEVHAHVGGQATEAAQAMGADAYANGNHVAFAAAPSLHTAAHEASHVIQQRGGVQLKGGVGAAGDPHERHADQVADAVVRGESAESMLDAYAHDSSRNQNTSAVQRRPLEVSMASTGPTSADAGRMPNGDGEGQLGYLLSQPARALGDPLVGYLMSLNLSKLLNELDEAAECGYSLQLEARLAAAPPILSAALQTVELARAKPMTPNHPALQRAGSALDLVSRDQQVQILSWVLHRHGVSLEAATLVEGVIAMKQGGEGERDLKRAPGAKQEQGVNGGDSMAGAGAGSLSPTAGLQMPDPIEPGKWSPPGRMPKWLYIGNAVHDAIAKHYEGEHLGQDIAANYVPISAILSRFDRLAATKGMAVDASALRQDELSKRPDIVNIDLQHLYEIKPKAAQAAGAAKAKMYVGILTRAGMQTELGPMGDPGAVGLLPAPNGVVIFETPEPGVITYDYQQARLVPVPVAAREPSTSSAWQWQIQPLSREQQAAIATTTIGGGILILLMIALSPLGA